MEGSPKAQRRGLPSLGHTSVERRGCARGGGASRGCGELEGETPKSKLEGKAPAGPLRVLIGPSR